MVTFNRRSTAEFLAMVFVILQIRCGARILKIWYGYNTSSVIDVYNDYSSGVLDNGLPLPDQYRSCSVTTQVGRNSSTMTQVSGNCLVGEVVNALGQYLEFSVSMPDDGSSVQKEVCQRDAFAMMMEASRCSNIVPQR